MMAPMINSEFEKYLSEYTAKLFSFSYALVSDDLQAQQLVIDSTTALFLDKKNLIEELLDTNDLSEEEPIQNEIEIFLLKHIVILANKRYSQLKTGLNVSKRMKKFFQS